MTSRCSPHTTLGLGQRCSLDPRACSRQKQLRCCRFRVFSQLVHGTSSHHEMCQTTVVLVKSTGMLKPLVIHNKTLALFTPPWLKHIRQRPQVTGPIVHLHVSMRLPTSPVRTPTPKQDHLAYDHVVIILSLHSVLPSHLSPTDTGHLDTGQHTPPCCPRARLRKPPLISHLG